MAKCLKCGVDLPDSPPNLEICANCLTDIIQANIEKIGLEEAEVEISG